MFPKSRNLFRSLYNCVLSLFRLTDGLFIVPPRCRSDVGGTIRSRVVRVCSASGLRFRFDELLHTDPRGEYHRLAELSGQISKSILTNCRGQSHWSSDRDERPPRSCVCRSLTWVVGLESLGPWSGCDLVAELRTGLNILFGDIAMVSERRSISADLEFQVGKLTLSDHFVRLKTSFGCRTADAEASLE
ncbi:hypothetical protein U1Q18_016898 [Sarracenia purpurea var. burkii]